MYWVNLFLFYIYVAGAMSMAHYTSKTPMPWRFSPAINYVLSWATIMIWPLWVGSLGLFLLVSRFYRK